MQTVIRRPAAEQLSNVQLREWQRYRGLTLKILQELEHSGGKTTRAISDGIGCRCVIATNALCRMLKVDLVERVERWGWRITVTGVFLLSLSLNTTTTQQQHNNNTTTTPQEKEEPAPNCFALATCHIQRLCKEKRYTEKNRVLCHHCVWDSPHRWITPRAAVEMKVGGVA